MSRPTLSKQQQIVYDDLRKRKEVSNLAIFERHKFTRLGDIIYNLRAKGVAVETVMIRRRGCAPFAKYRLGGRA